MHRCATCGCMTVFWTSLLAPGQTSLNRIINNWLIDCSTLAYLKFSFWTLLAGTLLYLCPWYVSYQSYCWRYVSPHSFFSSIGHQNSICHLNKECPDLLTKFYLRYLFISTQKSRNCSIRTVTICICLNPAGLSIGNSFSAVLPGKLRIYDKKKINTIDMLEKIFSSFSTNETLWADQGLVEINKKGKLLSF